jgi:hypothetical protein
MSKQRPVAEDGGKAMVFVRPKPSNTTRSGPRASLIYLEGPYILDLAWVCLVGWMKWVEVGWDGVISFFIVFGWELALSVRDERREKWDKSIPKKITDELILPC